jgi:hypothetical protein
MERPSGRHWDLQPTARVNPLGSRSSSPAEPSDSPGWQCDWRLCLRHTKPELASRVAHIPFTYAVWDNQSCFNPLYLGWFVMPQYVMYTDSTCTLSLFWFQLLSPTISHTCQCAPSTALVTLVTIPPKPMWACSRFPFFPIGAFVNHWPEQQSTLLLTVLCMLSRNLLSDPVLLVAHPLVSVSLLALKWGSVSFSMFKFPWHKQENHMKLKPSMTFDLQKWNAI